MQKVGNAPGRAVDGAVRVLLVVRARAVPLARPFLPRHMALTSVAAARDTRAHACTIRLGYKQLHASI